MACCQNDLNYFRKLHFHSIVPAPLDSTLPFFFVMFSLFFLAPTLLQLQLSQAGIIRSSLCRAHVAIHCTDWSIGPRHAHNILHSTSQSVPHAISRGSFAWRPSALRSYSPCNGSSTDKKSTRHRGVSSRAEPVLCGGSRTRAQSLHLSKKST